MKTKRLGCWIVIVAFAIVAIFIAAANAHDHTQPNLDSWFNKLQSGKGLCCSNNDGTALSDVDWRSSNGRYQVRLDGKWIEVPDDAVITEPNLAGPTMVWPLRTMLSDGTMGYSKAVTIRCFMPGPFV